MLVDVSRHTYEVEMKNKKQQHSKRNKRKQFVGIYMNLWCSAPISQLSLKTVVYVLYKNTTNQNKLRISIDLGLLVWSRFYIYSLKNGIFIWWFQPLFGWRCYQMGPLKSDVLLLILHLWEKNKEPIYITVHHMITQVKKRYAFHSRRFSVRTFTVALVLLFCGRKRNHRMNEIKKSADKKPTLYSLSWRVQMTVCRVVNKCTHTHTLIESNDDDEQK